MKTKILFLLASAAFIFTSCIKDEVDQVVKNYTDEEYAILHKSLNLPIETFEYTLKLPNHLGGFPVFANNHQATLGRVLFYDKNLSGNGQVSCATCHKAEKAFADDAAFSLGVSTTDRTSRNSLGLGAFPSFNGYYGFGNGTRMFWDERAPTVMEQSRQSFLNPVEMGVGHMSDLTSKVQQYSYYDVLFKKAFPSQSFVGMSMEDKILTALQAFVNSLGVFDTKFDREMKTNQSDHLTFKGFTSEENLGKTLFKTNCESCHNLGAGFATFVTVANNGLDVNSQDLGVGGISGRSSDMGVFKVPMLRNIALSAPYMHDGRFATLEEVVEHYSTGMKNHPNLHENLKAGNQPKNLNLSPGEKAALVAFLHTLTDEKSLMHERFSNPFK